MARSTVADLLLRYDANDIGDLVSDVGDQVSPADLLANEVALAAIGDAQGDVDSALLAGNRYTVAEITGLTGNSESKLKRIECGRAMYYLLCRRPSFDPERLDEFDSWTRKQLERLRKGENVFDLEDQKDAGVLSHAVQTIQSVANMNLIRDQTWHYYPQRTFPKRPN